MKFNRRKAMGVVAGGALAGPSVIREARSTMPSMLPSHPPPYYGIGQDATPKSDGQFMANQIARAKRIAAGDIRDEDRNYPTAGPPDPFASLRSMSPAAKQTLMNRRYEIQWTERTIAAARKALEEYDKTGLIRHFF